MRREEGKEEEESRVRVFWDGGLGGDWGTNFCLSLSLSLLFSLLVRFAPCCERAKSWTDLLAVSSAQLRPSLVAILWSLNQFLARTSCGDLSRKERTACVVG